MFQKKRGDFRFILDLRYVNRCCVPQKFKNEDINTVIDIDRPKDYMRTADLKNVFFFIFLLVQSTKIYKV